MDKSIEVHSLNFEQFVGLGVRQASQKLTEAAQDLVILYIVF
jgi:hypothetical protein